MASIGTNYDPATTAQALAESSTAARQAMLTRQSEQASATEKALGTLGSVLNSFQSSLAALTGLNKTMAATSAVFSDTAVASATASPTAAAGTYSFFVEQLASAHQVSYSGVRDITGTSGGTLTFASTVGEPPTDNTAHPTVERFTITLTERAYTVRELAAAINGDAKNTSVLASVVSGTNADGTSFSELVLTSKLTGKANNIQLTTGGDANAAFGASTRKDLVPAQDAIVRIGSSAGTATYSATNTFNVVDGVAMTVSKAQAAGSAPVTLTVGTDTSKTTANVQSFVDAYNKLKSAIDGLVSPGDPSSGATAGAFAGDSGVRALRDRLIGMVRATGTTSLASYGITANRQGTLSLDSTRLTKALAANPTGLDTLIGSASSTASSGIAGKLDVYIKVWTDSTNGQIGNRKDAVSKLRVSLTERQTTLDRQYDSAYARYLAQFTQLQSIQSSMTYNTSLFDAMFSDSKD
ncbi:flagellar filament capping protein FliD [Massilia niabensis]|uniref:Flagellar hook-associated protein 2 n=1 Tax=Massilia niabensis TaxID=544910 RepID=A0ABW0KYX8_9BURK